jgi:hypothetical protein
MKLNDFISFEYLLNQKNLILVFLNQKILFKYHLNQKKYCLI